MTDEQSAAASPAGAPGLEVTTVNLLGMPYLQQQTADGGELFLTRHGLAFREQLKPENWYEKEWFRAHREPLRGTSTIYKVRTRPAGGRPLDLVVKWCRVGQDVPLETRVIESVLQSEFNSPFEEFALVEEMRTGRFGPAELRIHTHRPLAIYVPPDRLQLWQTGRTKYKINMKIRRHPGIELDVLRQYIFIYEWIKGLDASVAFEELKLPTVELHALTHRVIGELRQKGFFVADMKPAHIIVRCQNQDGLVRRHGQIAYALVDFELLARTAEHQEQIRRIKRADYLLRQCNRMEAASPFPLPPSLHRQSILGVNYIQGRVQSTEGMLWVVGNDPYLFDYYQPERWRRTPHVRLSESHQVYYTKTKDDIYLVWKTSRVGETPEIDPEHPDRERLLSGGYNSPFEEFAIALELERLGIATTQPRAIYRTGSKSSQASDYIVDLSRFRSMESILTPDGLPVLRPDHDYIKIWGYWNGPLEHLVKQDGAFYHGLDLMQAYQEDLLSARMMRSLMDRMQQRLAEVGYEAPGLEAHHLLVTADPAGDFILDREGNIETRLCNFETIRRPAGAPGGGSPTGAGEHDASS